MVCPAEKLIVCATVFVLDKVPITLELVQNVVVDVAVVPPIFTVP
jgi:hypothetical protein